MKNLSDDQNKRDPKKFWMDCNLSVVIVLAFGLASTLIIGFLFYGTNKYDVKTKISGELSLNKEKVDDWQYGSDESVEDINSINTGNINFGMSAESATKLGGSPSDLGLSVGGAKDINNFRDNIENDYLPLTSDITYEGLFYDYYFDTGKSKECSDLFCPSYSMAVSEDPISGEEEYYLSVGLNSGIKESDFERKKLNLVVVLDISGSMISSFNSYYYDRFRNMNNTKEDNGELKSKMQVATESINSLLDHLNKDDRFGMVLYDSSAYLAKPLNPVVETDITAIKDHISELSPRGGTQMSAGMQEATKLFEEYKDINTDKYENRIIFLTDAMPNMGETSEEGLLGITKSNSLDKVYSTFIGIGVDFNTELIEAITKIRGANYYSVHSPEEFNERMDDQFEYMVTPLVFDLNLTLEADGYDIEKVYGSPGANEATGEIMKVNTLFPSAIEGGETKGGLVLLKLNKISDNASLNLEVSYEDRNGKKYQNQENIDFPNKNNFYDNLGIRKGILLSNYADLIKNWIRDERVSQADEKPILPLIDMEEGIVLSRPFPIELGKWERQSLPLEVSGDYKDLFKEFLNYFEEEMDNLGDDSLEQEREILEKLIK